MKQFISVRAFGVQCLMGPIIPLFNVTPLLSCISILLYAYIYIKQLIVGRTEGVPNTQWSGDIRSSNQS